MQMLHNILYVVVGCYQGKILICEMYLCNHYFGKQNAENVYYLVPGI